MRLYILSRVPFSYLNQTDLRIFSGRHEHLFTFGFLLEDIPNKSQACCEVLRSSSIELPNYIGFQSIEPLTVFVS